MSQPRQGGAWPWMPTVTSLRIQPVPRTRWASHSWGSFLWLRGFLEKDAATNGQKPSLSAAGKRCLDLRRSLGGSH